MKQSKKTSTKNSSFWNQEIKLNTFLKLSGAITLLLIFVGLPIWYVYSAITYVPKTNFPNKIITLPTSTFTPTPTQIPITYASNGWKIYSNKDYGFSFSFPSVWSISSLSHMFKDGDTIEVYIFGPTQKKQTDWYDGAFFTVAVPQATQLSLEEWLNVNNWTKPSELTRMVPKLTTGPNLDGRRTLQITLSCEEINKSIISDCGASNYFFTNLFTKVSGEIYGIALFSRGNQKSQYDQDIKQIISSFKFL